MVLDKARHTFGTHRSFPEKTLQRLVWSRPSQGWAEEAPLPQLVFLKSPPPPQPALQHPTPPTCLPALGAGALPHPWPLDTAPCSSSARALALPGCPEAGLCPEEEATEGEPSRPEHRPSGVPRLSGWAGPTTSPPCMVSRARFRPMEVSETNWRGRGGLSTLTLELKHSSDDTGAWSPATPGAGLATPVGAPRSPHSHQCSRH